MNLDWRLLGEKCRITEEVFVRAARIAPAIIAAGVLFLLTGTSAAKRSTTPTTFDTPDTYAWTVPGRVTRATFDVFGAAGGRGGNDNAGRTPGGLGGEATATLNVSPGQVFEIVVGGAGGDSAAANDLTAPGS